MSEELVLIPKETALQVFTQADGLAPYLQIVRKEIDSFKPDISTRKGREEVASLAYKVAKVRAYIDGVGKELNDVQKEVPKKIDAARKLARDTLDLWKDEVRKPLTEWETAEEARKSWIKKEIESFQFHADDRVPRSSLELKNDLVRLQFHAVSELAFGVYFDAAVAAHKAGIESLTARIAEAEQRERDAAELAELRKAAAERGAKEREERIAREAAEQAKADAEAHAKRLADEAERKANAEAQAAAQREREALAKAQQAEADRVAAVQCAERAEAEAKAKAEKELADKVEAERVETAKREANKAHKAKINNTAVAAFIAGGMTEEMAKLAVTLIAKKSIPAITVAY